MRVQANGISLYYTTTGQGAPVVLLHGNGEDHHIFDPLMERLRGRYALYALDSRNHGQSERTGLYEYQAMAKDVRAWMAALGLEKPSIVGFSDGAIVALLLALDAPQAVGRLALLGINLRPEDFLPDILEEIKEGYRNSGDPLLKLMLEQPDIPLDALAGVTNPVLLIAGENDLFRPELYPAMAKALPDARLHILPGQTHDSYVAQPEELAALLVEFLG